MFILVLSPNEKRQQELAAPLQEAGWSVESIADISRAASLSGEDVPRLVLVDASYLGSAQVEEALERSRQWKALALLVLMPKELASPNLLNSVDDFVVEPLRSLELASRVRRLLWKVGAGESRATIRVGDLTLDQERYEVRVSGRLVRLTYKEYELLRLLASYPGRVFTREELLSKVWGYDYFGGTRTVDVHVRRLRSNIEDADHSFIETVWGVGYRLRLPT